MSIPLRFHIFWPKMPPVAPECQKIGRQFLSHSLHGPDALSEYVLSVQLEFIAIAAYFGVTVEAVAL